MNEPAYTFRPINRADHELLVVDDNPANLYTTARLLRNAGFRVREASNGAQCLASVEAGGLSAMVIDVHLPDIDGFELCRILRSRPETLRMPVLHLSAAYVTDEDKVRGLDSGADAYLTHPVEPAVLVATVQALVRTRVAEEAMRQSELKFRAIYERAPSGIGRLDEAGRFLDANPALLAMLGQDLDALSGRALTDLVPPAYAGAAAAFLAGPGGEAAAVEFPVQRAGGELAHLAWNISPCIEAGVHLVVATDLSPRARLEEQRRQLLERERVARGEAEKLSRMKDTFIAVLSHELRSPLNAIMGWVHVLQKRGGNDETMRGLDAIERNGRLQARMISDLLDMARLNHGKLPMSFAPTDPAEIINTAAQTIQPLLADSGIDLLLDLEPGYEPIVADNSRLQQVVWNLLSNAIKFSSRGGRVWVQLRQQPQGLLLVVRDEGQGIAPEFLSQVFDRFMQSDAGSNRLKGGLGLGLSIVKQLVEAHGGTVRAHSAGLGQGARFDVQLPKAPPPAPALITTDLGDLGPAELAPFKPSDLASLAHKPPAALPVTASPADPLPLLAGMRLLVVDDDPDALALLQIILSDQGAEVVVVQNYDGALKALSQSRFDALISDIGMPGLDGYDLARELRRREAASGTGARLPAIALTSFARAQDAQQALDAGFDAHLAKPLRPLSLIRLLGQCMRPR